MDFWEAEIKKRKKENAPLAEKCRPVTWEEVKGQEHLTRQDAPFRKLLRAKRPPSFILYGQPGVGKTTLAYICMKESGLLSVNLSAVESRIEDIRNTVKKAEQSLLTKKTGTLLFVDECHQLSKAQQNLLLPNIENGTLVFLGATTENPGVYLVPPLLSRCQIYELNSLEKDDVVDILKSTSKSADITRNISQSVIETVAEVSGGDARFALNLMETILECSREKEVSIEEVQNLGQKTRRIFQSKGDTHYDLASAFQKSIRGSDPHAAIYWLARMIDAGEDPKFISRRLIVTAAEDISNADPMAMVVAVSAAEAVERIGLPEGRIPLAQAATYLATCPKSDSSIKAIDEALAVVKQEGRGRPVPVHIKDGHHSSSKKLGWGRNYVNPHNCENHWANQSYLPDDIVGKEFYRPGDFGMEKIITKRMEWWKRRK